MASIRLLMMESDHNYISTLFLKNGLHLSIGTRLTLQSMQRLQYLQDEIAIVHQNID
ncbi:hypothetical protein [Bacillus sp. 1NLA3E]|uniref:hypothetical protein n=1 Tax=Bacillus sp. 1NLA3E TaxID=666686 RepID=UPI001650DFED|nr:hypothetical protein [Bacillus sp. 1NLA3E]